MKLYKHQEKFVKGYKDKALLVHEGGTGKTICACLWLKDNRDSDALVICPKRIIEKWKDTLKDFETKATVLSKEQFKKYQLKKWSAVVVDEADEFASPLFNSHRSQLSTSLYNLVKAFNMPTLLLTATPIRSTPWNLHSLLCFLKIYIPAEKWKNYFFNLEMRPYLPRPAFFPKKDWRIKIRPILEETADIVLLRDCIDYLPPFTEKTLLGHFKAFQGDMDWEPSRAFVEEHRFEQLDKVKTILKSFGRGSLC